MIERNESTIARHAACPERASVAVRERAPRRVSIGRVGEVVCVVSAASLCALFLTSILDVSASYRAGEGDVLVQMGASLALRSIPVFVILSAVLLGLLSDCARSLRDTLFRYRYVIGLVVVVVATALELSGSSIARWGSSLGADPVQGTLFGVPRLIRSDEYLVNTPFAVSQSVTGFPGVSDVIRGCPTDVTLVYAQPSWSLSTLFRPFLWGYLLLGASRGLAFFWSTRLVALALVSLDFGLLMSRGSRGISIAYTALVTFSPVVQWWFAINGLVEMLVFGQGLVLALHAFLYAGAARARWALAVLMGWMAACYVMVVYPAWQVPLFWVFLAMGIGVIIDFARGDGISARVRDFAPPVCAALLIFLVSLVAALVPALDSVKIMAETAYPGVRSDAGGSGMWVLLGWVSSILNPLRASEALPNACELSGFFSLAPIGLLVGGACLCVGAWQGRKVDVLLLAALLAEFLFGIYVVVGLPEPLASVTLLSHSTAGRVSQVMGLADLIVFLRVFGFFSGVPAGSRAVDHEGRLVVLRRPIFVVLFCVALTVFVTCFLVVWARSSQGLRLGMCALLAGCLALMCVGVLAALRGRSVPIMAAALVVVTSGLCVNPLQRGVDALVGSREYIAVGRVNASDEGVLWAADDSILGQLCVSAGAPCVNSVNVYPVLSRWHTLDTDGSGEKIYNRYAHIKISVDSTVPEPRFTLQQDDSFEVTLTPSDLSSMGIRYFVSRRGDLGSVFDGVTGFELVEQAGSLFIWKVVEEG